MLHTPWCTDISLTVLHMANRPTHNLIARKMPQDHQQEGLHMSTRITYILRSSKCHKTISKKACTCQPESHTFYKHANATWPLTRGSANVNQNHLHSTSIMHANATRPSAKRPAHVNQDHLLPTSMQQDHQQEGLQMSTKITYILRADKCHKIISKRACTCQPELLTY